MRDKSFKIKSKSKYLQSLTRSELEKCIRINHTIENPDFFDLDEVFHQYIPNHIKKFDFYLVKYVFRLVFDEKFYLLFNTDLESNLSIFSLKRYFLLWVENSFERRCKLSHSHEMNITTISNKR